MEAAAALHAEKGIAMTSMKDIAARADVGTGTMYHHFASYEDVVRACGSHMRVLSRPPTPEMFAEIPGLSHRVELLVRELFAYYERYPSFERGRCDRDKLPALAEAVAQREQYLESVVRSALGRQAEDEEVVRLVAALTDFAVHRALTREGSTSTEAAAAQVAEVLVAWLRRHATGV